MALSGGGALLACCGNTITRDRVPLQPKPRPKHPPIGPEPSYLTYPCLHPRPSARRYIGAAFTTTCIALILCRIFGGPIYERQLVSWCGWLRAVNGVNGATPSSQTPTRYTTLQYTCRPAALVRGTQSTVWTICIVIILWVQVTNGSATRRTDTPAASPNTTSTRPIP